MEGANCASTARQCNRALDVERPPVKSLPEHVNKKNVDKSKASGIFTDAKQISFKDDEFDALGRVLAGKGSTEDYMLLSPVLKREWRVVTTEAKAKAATSKSPVHNQRKVTLKGVENRRMNNTENDSNKKKMMIEAKVLSHEESLAAFPYDSPPLDTHRTLSKEQVRGKIQQLRADIAGIRTSISKLTLS
jgi:hypothetical protein